MKLVDQKVALGSQLLGDAFGKHTARFFEFRCKGLGRVHGGGGELLLVVEDDVRHDNARQPLGGLHFEVSGIES